MLTKKDTITSSALSEHRFFSLAISKTSDAFGWQLIYSDYATNLFFNPKLKTILGFGNKRSFLKNDFYSFEANKPWTIPIREEYEVSQAVAGDGHILILYTNGLLEGYGCGYWGQLGVGCFANKEFKSVPIPFPEDEIPVQIAAADNYSLVITNKGILYGFGSNDRGQLGLGEEEYIEFPTPIPLPEGAIPDQIYTRHDRTIIVCQNGELYGFGDGGSGEFGERMSFKQRTTVRLKTFESLNPQTFCIGKNATIVLSQEGECFFYGINIECSLPVDYSNRRTLILPSGVKAKQLSYTHRHLILRSEEGELWFTKPKGWNEKAEFVKFRLPYQAQARSIAAGYETSFIFSEDCCYGIGDNESFQLGLSEKRKYNSPQELPLKSMYTRPPKNKLLVKPLCPEALFLEQEKTPHYQDNTELITIFEQDEGRVIEIISPFNHRLTLSMLYSFYSRSAEQFQACFSNKKIANHNQLMKIQGTIPVIFLDLGLLDFSSHSDFLKSYSLWIAALYSEHKMTLFKGYLKDKQKEKNDYLELATEEEGDLLINALPKLTEYLYQQYGKKVKLFINNADLPLRYEFCKQNYDYIVSRFIPCINPAIGGFLHEAQNPYVSQTIMLGMHPSPLGTSNRHVHGLFDSDSKYLPFFQGSFEDLIYEKKHFINRLKVKPAICNQIGELLVTKQLHVQLNPNKTIESGAAFELFPCLIQAGLIKVTLQEDKAIVLSIASDKAQMVLQNLLKKWQIQNLRRITVILDIDHVLAMHDKCSIQTLLFFLRRGSVLSAYGVTHYIPPGILELIQFLYSTPLVKVAFFSSGDSKRNLPFVKALLIKALGQVRYDEIAADLIILSNHNLSYGKKDLSFAIAEEDELENAIFIDNDPRFVCKNQEKHYLHTETVQAKDFADLTDSTIFCNTPEDSLFRKVNAPFYLASIVQNCILNKDVEPVCEKLFNLQHGSEASGEQQWDKSKKCLASYEEGLVLLQPYNQELTLINSSIYQNVITPPPSNAQQEEIKVAKAHEYEDQECRLM